MLILKGILNDLRQMLSPIRAGDVSDPRGEVKNAPLRNCTLNQFRDIGLGVPNGLQAPWDA